MPVAIIAVGVFISSLILVSSLYAQESPEAIEDRSGISGIAFPVAELGNCQNKQECKSYCDNPDNIEACVAFAESRGLMNKEEAGRAKKFSASLRSAGGGPGGCRTPEGCRQFCENINNLETCLSFAAQQGIGDKDINEGKKIAAYLKSGGSMPGGCTSRQACERYCGDFDHAEECLAFSEKVGLEDRDGSDGSPSPEQFRKMKELIQKGETPGGCRTKDQCESYCGDASHREECLAFGEKMGFLKPEEVQRIRATGGKGPGGCDSKKSCEQFCNAPENRETCFAFAKEHGLLKEEDERQIKEGLVRLRTGLEQAPPEVQACLKTALGEEAVNKILSGDLVPGPDIGEKMKGCFEKFGHRESPEQMFRNAPPEVMSCLKGKLGDDFSKIQSGEKEFTPEIADTFRVCFESIELTRGGGEMGAPRFQNFVKTAPPEIEACLKDMLGDEFSKIQSGEKDPGPELMGKARSCFERFKPQDMMRPQGEENRGNRERRDSGLPPAAEACLRQTLGDQWEAFREGRLDPALMQKAQQCFGQSPEKPASFLENSSDNGANRPGTFSGSAPRFNFPPQAITCLQSSLAGEDFEKLMRGAEPSADARSKIQSCMGALQSSDSENRKEPQRSEPGSMAPEGSIRPQELQPPQNSPLPEGLLPPLNQNSQFPTEPFSIPPSGSLGIPSEISL